tara:strand:- start:3335 stop:3766 length:432 start_codon:yes stop_codon:yes gene_type:complete
MQYQVPQFTDVEDKIFGPLTLKQFVYIAGGVGLSFLLWRALPLFAAAPLILGVLGISGSLAFIKINNKPFIAIAEAAFMYFISSKLYLWNTTRKEKQKEDVVVEKSGLSPDNIPSLSDNKLTNLAWSLDINERLHTDREREVQ